MKNEFRSNKELHAEALLELKDESTIELRRISTSLCFHKWYRDAAIKVLASREISVPVPHASQT